MLECVLGQNIGWSRVHCSGPTCVYVRQELGGAVGQGSVGVGAHVHGVSWRPDNRVKTTPYAHPVQRSLTVDTTRVGELNLLLMPIIRASGKIVLGFFARAFWTHHVNKL